MIINVYEVKKFSLKFRPTAFIHAYFRGWMLSFKRYYIKKSTSLSLFNVKFFILLMGLLLKSHSYRIISLRVISKLKFSWKWLWENFTKSISKKPTRDCLHWTKNLYLIFLVSNFHRKAFINSSLVIFDISGCVKEKSSFLYRIITSFSIAWERERKIIELLFFIFVLPHDLAILE